MTVNNGLDAICSERDKQVALGYTVEHDAEHHTSTEFMQIAACYADFAANEMNGMSQDEPHPFWPETSVPWKPKESPLGTATMAAAFIAAAIDLFQKEMEL